MTPHSRLRQSLMALAGNTLGPHGSCPRLRDHSRDAIRSATAWLAEARQAEKVRGLVLLDLHQKNVLRLAV
jgi:hypothetical protein